MTTIYSQIEDPVNNDIVDNEIWHMSLDSFINFKINLKKNYIVLQYFKHTSLLFLNNFIQKLISSKMTLVAQ